ncbi:MAG TPA: cytochrome c-type biogenesis protein CcmH [Acidimicrobiales bacterium]|nr:cytochrome c-type biogenesis protein CcmH [Acidimicrobiales bacterium]
MQVHARGVRWTLWGSLAVALAASLALGASRPAGAPTPAQRAAAIDAVLRCPSCEDISVAASSAPVAVAIREVVARRVAEGQSTAQIEAFLESRYGPGILLRPPASGVSILVWVVPLVALALGALGLGALFWRRRRLEPLAGSDADSALVEEALVATGRSR